MRALGAAALVLIPLLAGRAGSHTLAEWEDVLAGEARAVVGVGVPEDAGTLRVEIVDGEAGVPTPAMIHLVDESGALWIPDEAVPIARGGYAYAERLGASPRREGARTAADYAVLGEFTCRGRFQIELPPGTYSLRIRKGREYRSHHEKIRVEPGRSLARKVVLTRWIDMPGLGWYSGDGHLHYARRNRAANARLMTWIQAEDLHVANVLRMADARRIYFPQYAFGRAGRHRAGNHVLVPGEETPRSNFIGHLTALNPTRGLRRRQRYYLYPDVIEEIRKQGGIPIIDHITLLTMAGGSARLLALAGHRDVTLGQVTVGFTSSWAPYYRSLDLGMRLDLSAGSDVPWNLGSLASEPVDHPGIGHHRIYVRTGTEFDPDRWFEGLERGNTFVSYGDFPILEVNDQPPGSEIRVSKGDTVRIRATVHASPENEHPTNVEILVTGEVRWQATQPSRGEPVHLSAELTVESSVWIACRSTYGHTSPVYVRVGDEPWWSRERFPGLVQRRLQLLDQLAARERIGPGTPESMEDEALFQAQRGELSKHIERAKRFYRDLEARFRETAKQ